MTTDLFAAARGLPPDWLSRVVPPACRRDAEPPPSVQPAAGALCLEFPPWTPRRPARHLVASLALPDAPGLTFRFEVAVERAGRWSPWVATATIGPGALAPAGGAATGLEAEIDEWRVQPPAERVRLRVRMRGVTRERLDRGPWLVTLSASDLGPAGPAPPPPGPVVLEVPPLSQREAPAELAPRICSPTSLAMVLAFHGAAVAPEALAAEVFHPGLDRYGVWPAAIQAAAARGVLGYLLRFPDWAAAAWCLAQGLPVIASLRYRAGALAGAPLPEAREGHLVVLRGAEDDHVLVNDPAAPDRATVVRRYRRVEFCAAWLGGTGVGYVLFRPDARARPGAAS